MMIPRPDGSHMPDPSRVIASLARDQVNVHLKRSSSASSRGCTCAPRRALAMLTP